MQPISMMQMVPRPFLEFTRLLRGQGALVLLHIFMKITPKPQASVSQEVDRYQDVFHIFCHLTLSKDNKHIIFFSGITQLTKILLNRPLNKNC
jgi:hypothetical protein